MDECCVVERSSGQLPETRPSCHRGRTYVRIDVSPVGHATSGSDHLRYRVPTLCQLCGQTGPCEQVRAALRLQASVLQVKAVPLQFFLQPSAWRSHAIQQEQC